MHGLVSYSIRSDSIEIDYHIFAGKKFPANKERLAAGSASKGSLGSPQGMHVMYRINNNFGIEIML